MVSFGLAANPRKALMSTIFSPHIESDLSKKLAESRSRMKESGSETILVAEDDASVRILTCRILHNHGYKVLEAVDGKDALRLATEYEEEIHLILSDTIMPGMGGGDAVERISAIRPGIKSVYMSGYADTAIFKSGILDRDIAFLQKPFEVNGLLQKVRAELDADK
jgi:two-component system, cell cycle sensor histidine kinase and response regulator CckA